MKIIISPAKKMKIDEDSLAFLSMPVFLEETTRLMNWIKLLNIEEAKNLWECNDRLAQQNFERFQNMRLDTRLIPAIISSA